jgi:hypothetical protein
VERQRDDELAAAARSGTRRTHGPAVHLRKAFHDGQSDSQPTAFATGLEHVENRRQPVGGNAAARITHADDDGQWLLLDDELNLATGFRELDGIGQQVQDDAQARSLIVSDKIGNRIVTFHFPEIF